MTIAIDYLKQMICHLEDDQWPSWPAHKITAAGMAEKLKQVVNEHTALMRASKATLLFHRGGEWTDKDRRQWNDLTGHGEATNKALCDMHRLALGGSNDR